MFKHTEALHLNPHPCLILSVSDTCVPQVLETCVKNCGHRFHVLVANRDFIDGVLVKIISPKSNPPTIVQDKVLALIQVSDRVERWRRGSE